MIIICPCGRKITTSPLKARRKKYCSKKCFYKYRKRPSGLKYVIHKENPTSFKKGHKTWNKGTAGLGICKANSGSIKKGEHRGSETEFNRDRVVGENNNKWKGDDVGYFALHTWIQRKLGKAQKCVFCGIMKDKKRIDWANKSREYKRELNDWISLCSKCHGKYDTGYRGAIKQKWQNAQ